MRAMLITLVVAGCGSSALEPSTDASVDAPITADAPPDASTGPTCRRDPSLDGSCRFTFEQLHGFSCDPGAPLVGDGYADCYTSGGLPGDPDFLMCCRDE